MEASNAAQSICSFILATINVNLLNYLLRFFFHVVLYEFMVLFHVYLVFLGLSIAAWAAASRAMGTRNGEQLT